MLLPLQIAQRREERQARLRELQEKAREMGGDLVHFVR